MEQLSIVERPFTAGFGQHVHVHFFSASPFDVSAFHRTVHPSVHARFVCTVVSSSFPFHGSVVGSSVSFPSVLPSFSILPHSFCLACLLPVPTHLSDPSIRSKRPSMASDVCRFVLTSITMWSRWQTPRPWIPPPRTTLVRTSPVEESMGLHRRSSTGTGPGAGTGEKGGGNRRGFPIDRRGLNPPLGRFEREGGEGTGPVQVRGKPSPLHTGGDPPSSWTAKRPFVDRGPCGPSGGLGVGRVGIEGRWCGTGSHPTEPTRMKGRSSVAGKGRDTKVEGPPSLLRHGTNAIGSHRGRKGSRSWWRGREEVARPSNPWVRRAGADTETMRLPRVPPPPAFTPVDRRSEGVAYGSSPSQAPTTSSKRVNFRD
eukprot:scaffold435_cov342-Pavlova_lutheri.AAC.22